MKLRQLRLLLPAAIAAGVVAAVPLPASDPAGAAAPTVSQVSVAYGGAHAPVKGNLLSFNDFHGAIDPPVGSGAAVLGTPAGGVEYLATWVKRLRAQATADGRDSLTVGAGDLVGATPLVSAAFHDEPAIEEMNQLGLNISSVGNHEFDEGVTELRRLQRGGCHPVDGCADGDGFAGAKFTYLAANAVSRDSEQPILAPVAVRKIHGVKVGFVGMTLRGTAGIVNPAGIRDIEFLDEASTANRYARALRHQGVKAMVLLIHEGGTQTAVPSGPPPGVSDCANFSGPIADIVKQLSPEFGLVVSGHTHRYYTCSLPNAGQRKSVVTSAGSNGQIVTNIDLSLDRQTGRFAAITASNTVAVNGVRNADGSWQQSSPGVFAHDPALVDAGAKKIADKYRAAVTPIANKVVGAITGDISASAAGNGESPMGDVIADAQLAYTKDAGAQIALMNPGGIRASLAFGNSPGGEAPGQVTFGEAFTVQPFNNLIVTQTLTGEQLRKVLEQQFPGFAGQTVLRILQVSTGLRYAYDSTKPIGERISNLALNGVPIDPATSYRVTTNDFLANGGDGFSNLTAGTNRITAPKFDVDAFTSYLGSGAPIAPGSADRITKVG